MESWLRRHPLPRPVGLRKRRILLAPPPALESRKEAGSFSRNPPPLKLWRTREAQEAQDRKLNFLPQIRPIYWQVAVKSNAQSPKWQTETGNLTAKLAK